MGIIGELKGEIMNIRRLIYVLALVIAALLIYNYNLEDKQSPQLTPPEVTVSKESILNDFVDLTDKNTPEPVLGGTFYPTYGYFPADFQGKEGDMFYISMEDGHIGYTQKYSIQAIDKTQGNKTTYELIDKWEDYRPPEGRFEKYRYDGSKWAKVSEATQPDQQPSL